MSWSEIKKSINSDLNTPLNEFVESLSADQKVLLNSIISKLDNTTYGLSTLKTVLDTINTNSAKLNDSTYGLSALKTLIQNSSGGGTSYPNATLITGNNSIPTTVNGKGKATIYNYTNSTASDIILIIDGVELSIPNIGVGALSFIYFTFEKSFVLRGGSASRIKALIQTV